MKELLIALQAIGFLGAVVCFFWALKYRQDQGKGAPFMGINREKLTSFYGPKGAKIALIGSICFFASGSAMIVRWFLK